MNKAPASVKSVTLKDGETELVLVLDRPSTVSLSEGDRVHVELTSAITGSKVDFFSAQAEVSAAAPSPEQEAPATSLQPELEVSQPSPEPESLGEKPEVAPDIQPAPGE